MAIKYYLTKCNIKSSSNYGKYYARTLRGNEVTLADLERENRACLLGHAWRREVGASDLLRCLETPSATRTHVNLDALSSGGTTSR
jgi:hypothetical protein